jgi:hypothetical protein
LAKYEFIGGKQPAVKWLGLDFNVIGQSPAGKNLSTEAEGIVTIRHQATTNEDKDWEELNVCCSELFTYLRSWALLEKLSIVQLLKTFSGF